MASKPKPVPRKRKGYDEGGQISSDSLGRSIMGGAQTAASIYGAIKKGQYYKGLADSMSKQTPKPDQPFSGGGPAAVGGAEAGTGAARGGKIKQVAGKPVGKDDGMIPAQRGEYVVRKSAVNKLGTGVLNTINKGRLPEKKGKR